MELATELWIAREILSKPGHGNWIKYCQEIGIDRTTVHRWLAAAFPSVANATDEVTPLPPGKYQVIYADPPWEYDRSVGQGVAIDQYPLMPLEKIKALPD